MNRLARMVDPYLRVGIATEAKVQHRFLVAPFVPAIGCSTSNGEIAGLVMVELGDPVLALREAPFLRIVAFHASDAGQLLRDVEPMVAQAERKLRQRVEAHAVETLAPH